jgi:LPXTG-site transpeptidase (sortase) family protein
MGAAAVAGASTNGIYRPREQDYTVNEDYDSPMTLTIESIGISDINITPNVDSLNEEVYNEALKDGLAHFKGTPLPGDGGNSFVYGHSAVDSFFSNHPDDPETIFSRLEKVEIADTITIKKDGKILTYVVQKKKITEPDNFDVIVGTSRKETVTLMTCWPLGIGSKRLIVIGERTDG